MEENHLVITKKGNTISYIKSGIGDKTVLFIHGNLASSIWWKKTLKNIRKEYEAYALDLPGSGRTPETGYRHTMDYLAEFVYDFVTSLGLDRFFLVGHSMGGGIAQLFTIKHPTYVMKLVLVDSIAMDGFHGLFQLSEESSKSLMRDKTLLRRALKAVMPYCDDKEFFHEILRSAEGASEQVFLEQPQTMHEADWRDKIGMIKCPALFIHGKEDNFIPKEGSERTAKAIRNCHFLYLENCGHSPMIETPETFNKILFHFLEA